MMIMKRLRMCHNRVEVKVENLTRRTGLILMVCNFFPNSPGLVCKRHLGLVMNSSDEMRRYVPNKLSGRRNCDCQKIELVILQAFKKACEINHESLANRFQGPLGRIKVSIVFCYVS